MQHETDPDATQYDKSAREELGIWKVEINWNNCLLQWWISYRHYRYSQQNLFAVSTTASANQSLHFRLMWNHDILDLQRIAVLQVRKFWQNSLFASPNMKACWFHLINILSYYRLLVVQKLLVIFEAIV